MKIKDNFILQEITDDYIVVPVGVDASKLNGVIRLNDTGALLWKMMTISDITEEVMVQALLKEFEVDEHTAKADVKQFISFLLEMGCLAI